MHDPGILSEFLVPALVYSRLIAPVLSPVVSFALTPRPGCMRPSDSTRATNPGPLPDPLKTCPPLLSPLFTCTDTRAGHLDMFP